MTQPLSYVPGSTRVSPADRVLTVVLVLALGYVAVLGGLMGLALTIESDDCQGSIVPCFDGPTNVGFLASGLAPVVVWLAALVVVVVRWANRRTTWWVPLVAGALGLAVWALGLAAAATGAA